MAEPLDIFWHASKILLQNEFYKDRMVIVTGGGTIEKIDDVRYISNFSSGKMASAMATALYCMGANVKFTARAFPVGDAFNSFAVALECKNCFNTPFSIRIERSVLTP